MLAVEFANQQSVFGGSRPDGALHHNRGVGANIAQRHVKRGFGSHRFAEEVAPREAIGIQVLFVIGVVETLVAHVYAPNGSGAIVSDYVLLAIVLGDEVVAAVGVCVEGAHISGIAAAR